MRGEGKRLAAHLTAAVAEIERLRDVYSYAIDQLERYILANLSPQSAVKWFEMVRYASVVDTPYDFTSKLIDGLQYLRVVDLGVQIRRGEIRHRTLQQFTYPCRHRTGTKGAVHSGLSIDDGNAVFKMMEDGQLVKESQLEGWFGTLDTLDRDTIGSLDKRVTRCLEDFRRRCSVFYDRLEVTGEDPHEKMSVLAASGVVLSKITRTCFGPKDCSCQEDAKPWEDFCLKTGDPHTDNISSSRVVDGDVSNEVGITDIKRQMGFEELSRQERNDDAAALARDAAELARRKIPRGRNNTSTGGLYAPPSARRIYQKRCEENGSTPKPQINAVLVVKKGSHLLDLSGIGFHSADDLQDLVDIFATPGLPPVKELDVSNGFFNAASFHVLCHLLRLPLLRATIERLRLRGIAVPQHADFVTLMRILTSESSSIGSLPPLNSLKTLDLSFNTLWYGGAAQLQPLVASLQRLENLSLESCFPEPVSSVNTSPSGNDQKVIEESVRAALAEASTRLMSLNFGSNCAAIESRWLDALFTPGSILQKLELQGMSSSSLSFGDTTEAMEVDWQAGETWDLQQLVTLKWSSNNRVYSVKLLDALSAEFQGAFAQLKHLDMEVNIATEQDTSGQAARKVADIIARIADYAVLNSCRICCYSRNATMFHGVSPSVGRLLEDGSRECEMLTLRMPELYLTPNAICDLLTSAVVPKMRKMTLAFGIAYSNQVAQNIGSCILPMQSVQEFTLELHATVDEQNACAVAGTPCTMLARALEASWLALSSSTKLNRSFVLSEQQKANKRIYRCRFLVVPTP